MFFSIIFLLGIVKYFKYFSNILSHLWMNHFFVSTNSFFVFKYNKNKTAK